MQAVPRFDRLWENLASSRSSDCRSESIRGTRGKVEKYAQICFGGLCARPLLLLLVASRGRNSCSSSEEDKVTAVSCEITACLIRAAPTHFDGKIPVMPNTRVISGKADRNQSSIVQPSPSRPWPRNSSELVAIGAERGSHRRRRGAAPPPLISWHGRASATAVALSKHGRSKEVRKEGITTANRATVAVVRDLAAS